MKLLRLALVAALLFSAAVFADDDEDRGNKERDFKNFEANKDGLKYESETKTGDRKDKYKLEVELRAGKENFGSRDGVLRVKYEYEGELETADVEIEEETEIKVRFLGIVEHAGDAAFTKGTAVRRAWPSDFLTAPATTPGQDDDEEERKTQIWSATGMTGDIADGQMTATASSSLTFPGEATPTVVEFIGHASTMRRMVGNATAVVPIRPTDFKFDVHVVDWPWANDDSRLSLLFKIDSEYEFEEEHEDREGNDDDDDDDKPKNALVGGRAGAGARDGGIEQRPAFFWEPTILVDGASRNVLSSPLDLEQDDDDESEDPNGSTKWISFSYDGAAGTAGEIFWDPSVTAFYSKPAPADSAANGFATAAALAGAAVVALVA